MRRHANRQHLELGAGAIQHGQIVLQKQRQRSPDTLRVRQSKYTVTHHALGGDLHIQRLQIQLQPQGGQVQDVISKCASLRPFNRQLLREYV